MAAAVTAVVKFVTAILVKIGVPASIAGVVAAVAVNSAVFLAGNALQRALARQNPPGVPRPENGLTTLRQPVPPRVSGYGRCRLAGAYVLYEERNGTSVDVAAFHHGRIDLVEQVYLNDKPVSVAPGGWVQPLANGAYGQNKVQFVWRDGNPLEVPYSEVSAIVPDLWGASHRGDGIASFALICRGVASNDFGKIYPDNLPGGSVVARLQRTFDMRVAGASWNDLGARVWSSNPVLQLAHFLCDAETGMGFDYAMRIAPAIDSWIEAANDCDALIARQGGGLEKRYEAHGWYYHSTDPQDVLEAILASFDGWLSTRGDGAFVVRAGVWNEPTITLTSTEIVDFQVQKWIADEETVNEITPQYTSPEKGYTTDEAAAVVDIADQDARRKVRARPLSLFWVQSETQARRLAMRALRRNNSPIRGVMRCNFGGLAALGHRYIRIQNPALPSTANLTAEVQRVRIDLLRLAVQIEWVALGPDIDTPPVEGALQPAPPAGGVLDPLPTLSLQRLVAYTQLGQGTSIVAQWAPPTRTDLVYALRLTWTEASEAGPVPNSITEARGATFTLEGRLALATSTALYPGIAYTVAVIPIGPGGGFGEPSNELTITPPASGSATTNA